MREQPALGDLPSPAVGEANISILSSPKVVGSVINHALPLSEIGGHAVDRAEIASQAPMGHAFDKKQKSMLAGGEVDMQLIDIKDQQPKDKSGYAMPEESKQLNRLNTKQSDQMPTRFGGALNYPAANTSFHRNDYQMS